MLFLSAAICPGSPMFAVTAWNGIYHIGYIQIGKFMLTFESSIIGANFQN